MRTVSALTNLVYPPACLLCRTRIPSAETIFCDGCAEGMPRLLPPLCDRCGVGLPGAFDERLRCARCRTNPLGFDLARSPWWYAGPSQEALRQFKYHRRWRIGARFAEDMVAMARASLPVDVVDAVLPVPSHWLTHRLRGFGAAAFLAEAVARSLEKPYRPRLLSRTRWTATQTRLQGRERFRNVQGAFAAREQSAEGHTCLLVDDVLTSGATANACALALKAGGARHVFVLTATRTPRE